MASRLPSLRFVFALCVGSMLGAAFAIAVRGAIDGSLWVLFGSEDVLTGFRGLPLWARGLAPPIGALLGGLVSSLAAARLPESHGVADVMEALALGRGRVSLRTALAKTLGSFFAIVGGGSLGREGPLIQVGAALAGSVGRMLGVDPSRRRVLFAAGAAAGFAAAYNTPIAAALFVIEVLAGVFTLELLVPVLLSAALATTLSRLTLGDGPFYGLRSYALASPVELAGSVLLGPLGGIAGVLFMALLSRSEGLFAMLVPRSRPLRATLGGAVVGGIAMFLPEITGNGATEIREMLDGRVMGWMFLALLLAKPLATAASVGSGSSGGVFTPAMFLGAALGAGLASIVLRGGVEAHPVIGAYALVGLASVVAATTHAPLLATVLAFEMSGDYALVVPLLAASGLATMTARALRSESLYAAEAHRKGIVWEGSLASRVANAVRARELIEPALVVDASAPAAEVRLALDAHRARVAYALVGSEVRMLDLRTAQGAKGPIGIVGEGVEALSLEEPLPHLAELLWSVEWGELPVRAPDGTIAGIVTRRGLLGAFDRELLSRDLLLTRVTYDEGAHAALVELPEDYGVAMIGAPTSTLGAPVDVVALRRALGVWILAVRPRGSRSAWCDPLGIEHVEAGDRWLVLGARQSIEKLTKG